jgi:uncharacterized protein
MISPPLPDPNDDLAREFWQRCAGGRLSVQQCCTCRAKRYPPTALCPACLDVAGSFEFVDVPGTGRLRAWTVVRRAFLPAFVRDTPYVIGSVEIDGADGVRMVARVEGLKPECLAPGLALRVRFRPVSEAVAVPIFVEAGA